MQLLRDNLTLWTSSDGADADAPSEAPKEEKPAEAATDKPAEATEAPAAPPAAA
jgi:14-3-3 protein epsilon